MLFGFFRFFRRGGYPFLRGNFFSVLLCGNLYFGRGAPAAAFACGGRLAADGEDEQHQADDEHHRQGGDFGRMEAQATFLKALVQKVFSMGTAQVVSMAPSLIQYITTDLTLAQMLGYYNSIDGLDLNNINFHTLPVVGTMYNGLSVQSIKRYPTADLLNEYFRPYQNAVPAEGLDVIEIVKDYEYTPSNTTGDPSSGE